MTGLRRGLAVIAVALLGTTLVRQQGVGLAGIAGLFTDIISATPKPGMVTERSRPDLSGGDSDPNPVYTPGRTFERHDLTFAGALRHWSMLAPAGLALPPVVLLLHGSGRDGAAMLDIWQAIGARDALLIAPDSADPNQWSLADDNPAFLTAVLEAAFALHPFDRQRIYVYGHSAGATYALYLGACTNGPWRAVAVHAGSLPNCQTLTASARVPVLIQIGEQDRLFDLSSVRHSASRLGGSGHEVIVETIPRHGHWFYDIGPNLAADAWAFFSTDN